MGTYVPYFLFGLAVCTAVLAITLFIYSGRRERQEDVLLRLRAGDEAAAAASPLLGGQAKVHNVLVRWVCHLLWRAGADVEPPTAVRILLVLGAMVPITLLLLGWGAGAVVIVGVALFGVFILNRRAAQRRAKIVEQLPGFLESVTRVLTAGNTLEEAMAAGAREAQEPLRTLFLSVTRQVRLGAPLDAVLAEAAEIHRIRDLRVLALATGINRKYGGTLRNVFRSLIHAIRSRDAAARELRALTAETRFSALVLAALPVLIAAFIYFRTRSFYDQFLATDTGKLLFGVAIGLQLAGMFFIYRMMHATQDPDA